MTIREIIQSIVDENLNTPREALSLLVADAVFSLTVEAHQESVDGFHRNIEMISEAIENKPIKDQLIIAANSSIGRAVEILEAERATLYGCPEHSN